MSSERPRTRPVLTGQLADTPLFVVLRRIQRDRRNGTLSVLRGDQVRQLFFENGELRAARSSAQDHRIGATLVRWGYLSETDLAKALEIQKSTHERIDQILVELGIVTRATVDGEARRLTEQIIFSTLSWPDGTFHFEDDTGPVDLDVAVSFSSEMILEGIRHIPESEQFINLLGDLSAVPTLVVDPMSSLSYRLLREAMHLLQRIDGKVSASELLQVDAASTSASAKILYSLLFAGFIEMRDAGSAAVEGETSLAAVEGEPSLADLERELSRAAVERELSRADLERAPSRPPESLPLSAPVARGVTSGFKFDFRAPRSAEPPAAPSPPPPPSSPPPPPPPGARSHRGIVLDTYRRLDWLSHYDLLGVSRRARQLEIEKAYRERALLFDPTLKAHPDLVDCWRQLTVLSKWLKVAYEVLSNTASREAYDQKIEQASGFGLEGEAPGKPE